MALSRGNLSLVAQEALQTLRIPIFSGTFTFKWYRSLPILNIRYSVCNFKNKRDVAIYKC